MKAPEMGLFYCLHILILILHKYTQKDIFNLRYIYGVDYGKACST